LLLFAVSVVGQGQYCPSLAAAAAATATITTTTTTTTLHPFNGPLSGTTQVCRYQKGKTSPDFIEARDGEWQWHQLGHMQVCTSLQTDNHTNSPSLNFYRPNALPDTQPTVSKHGRQNLCNSFDKIPSSDLR